MATVKLDMRDPETKAVVNGWADDTEYTIRTGAGPSRAIVQVVEPGVEEEEEAAEPVEEEATEAAPASSPGVAAVKKAMGATL